ncbi:MAG: flagellar M-ring protein FliF C-terminal domain-containing protein, partial [Nitriliruptoraceae bacterium]
GSYERDDVTREFGVGRTTTTTVEAPGEVRSLDVALVVDEGAALGDEELEELVAPAAGVDEERGDRIAVSRVEMSAPPEAAVAEEDDTSGLFELIQRIVAMVVLVLIAVGLFLMSRRRRSEPEPRVVPAQLRGSEETADVQPTEPDDDGQQDPVRDEVAELVERQPEEIAMLLRGWLADRRG